MRVLVRTAALLGALVLPQAAGAIDIVTTLSQNRISITSSYYGGSIVVFGAIRADGAPPQAYDLVATVSGPRETVTSWRKGRVAGIWINESSQTFKDIPAFFGTFANRPLEQIAGEATLYEEKIGLKNALLPREQLDITNPFVTNLVRIRLEEGLYNEQVSAITFLSPTVFRAEIPLPANVPTGSYTVDLKAFANRKVVAQTATAFYVAKAGVEEFVVSAATNYALLYGLATMAMALTTGWLASLAFRRD